MLNKQVYPVVRNDTVTKSRRSSSYAAGYGTARGKATGGYGMIWQELQVIVLGELGNSFTSS